jgi:hypothetical protein
VNQSATPVQHTWLRRLLPLVWVGTLAIAMQNWIGGQTIYAPAVESRVTAAHEAILHNQPAGGVSWDSLGMNGVNTRLGVVYLAEALHRTAGESIPQAYHTIDTVALAAGMLLLLLYLRRQVGEPLALAGALFVATLLPLTYQLFYFHPWDRVSFVLWIALLWLLAEERLVLFALLLPVAVFVKYDVILLPLLYGLHVMMRDQRAPWRVPVRTVAVVAGLLLVSFGTHYALQAWRPGGAVPHSAWDMLRRNADNAVNMGIAWPPLLAFPVPVLLAALGFRAARPWAQACALFGVFLLAVFALQSNFAEVRAQVPVLLLLMPAALQALGAILVPSESGMSYRVVHSPHDPLFTGARATPNTRPLEYRDGVGDHGRRGHASVGG